jgi:hypothetical protein
MNNCKGIFGWVFGHKFKEYLIEKCVLDRMEVKGYSGTNPEELFSKFKNKYVVICKRCGERKES